MTHPIEHTCQAETIPVVPPSAPLPLRPYSDEELSERLRASRVPEWILERRDES